MQQEINSIWHHVDNVMPPKDEYVLVETRFCKYPFTCAFWNGVNWIAADDKSILLNTRFWAKIQTPN